MKKNHISSGCWFPKGPHSRIFCGGSTHPTEGQTRIWVTGLLLQVPRYLVILCMSLPCHLRSLTSKRPWKILLQNKMLPPKKNFIILISCPVLPKISAQLLLLWILSINICWNLFSPLSYKYLHIILDFVFWPTEPKIFAIWFFTEPCSTLLQDKYNQSPSWVYCYHYLVLA